MLLKFSPDLSKQEIWATGLEQTGIMGRREVGNNILVHTYDNPVLVTDNYRISNLNPTLRDTLFSILASCPRTVEYDGVSVTWDDSYKGVWSPSIDTLLLAKALNKVLINNPGIKSALEIGCGSGFLSKCVITKSKKLESIVINDINPFAIKSARDNINDPRAIYRVGDGLKELSDKTFDLIVCNPPYVPRPDSIENNPYEGVSLLHYLIHEGQKHLNQGGLIVVGASSLSDHLVFDHKPTMSLETLEEMEVPLKINNILNNDEWMTYLLAHGLKKDFHNGYEFWHRIETILAR